MTLLVSAWAVEVEDGRRSTVAREDGLLTVTWLCGDTRQFKAEDLASTVRNLVVLESLNDGLWYQDRDSNGESFAVSIKDGELRADTHPTDSAYKVPWADLREALVAAAPDAGWPAEADPEPTEA